jgi:hypothetical protein
MFYGLQKAIRRAISDQICATFQCPGFDADYLAILIA